MMKESIIFFLYSCFILHIVSCLSFEELEVFFNSTYIRKEPGEWSPLLKQWTSEGFNKNWDIYHFHHVCIKKGGEGIFVGLQGLPNPWKENIEDKFLAHLYMNEEEFNKMHFVNDLRENLLETYYVKRVPRDGMRPSKIHLLNSSSYFFNCADTDGDWLIKLGVLYELALYFGRNEGETTFKFKWDLPFRNLLMNRCEDLSLTPWQIGNNCHLPNRA